jgi:carotenoid cleavage dioxygenase-like enzyme
MTHTTSDTPDTSALFEFFQQGNYAPVADELTEFDLPVEGAIPAELDGWYLRNGPNPRQATAHWFTGDGMIHGVRIQGGRAAWYRNRWVRTESFDNGLPLYNADGTRNLRASHANTHVVNHAGKTLALVESSLPYQISNDLHTLGAYDFGGKLVDSMTAHPKICPTSGELHFFGYGNIFTPHVTYHRADANGELTINRPLDVPALTMMHDFALTAEHVVFMDLPIVFNLDVAIKDDGDMPYRWDDNYGAARCAAPRRSARRGAVVRYRPVLRLPCRQCLRRRLSGRIFHCAASGSLSGTLAGHQRVRDRRGAVELDHRPGVRPCHRTSGGRPRGGVPAYR